MNRKPWTVHTKRGVEITVKDNGDFDAVNEAMMAVYVMLQVNGLMDGAPLQALVAEYEREHRQQRMDELDCEGSA